MSESKRRTLRILPWVLFVVAAAAAVTFGLLWNQARAEEARRADLVATARQFVSALTDFSSATISRDVEEIRSFAAGRFEDEVDELFSEETIAAISEAEARSESEIDAIFVQQLDETTASVFAVATVSIENNSVDEARTDVVRMEIGFVAQGDGWNVDSVELFQSPGAPGLAPLG
ncbi:MAG TPA: hypothetical protein VM784_08410 [Actinomycetota bacterium]|nr:hypothetical protein [Actinomycetota bacterium]